MFDTLKVIIQIKHLLNSRINYYYYFYVQMKRFKAMFVVLSDQLL